MKDVLDKQNRSFAAAMARVSGSFGGRAPAPPFKVGPLPAAAPKLPVPIDPEAVSLGETEFGAPLSINLGRLLDGRLMVQGASGAGKSWLLRRIVEQIGDRLQQIVIDKEGEFDTLAEEMRWPYVTAHQLDEAALAKLARRLREQRLSVIIDFSELDPRRRLEALPALVNPLIEAPRELWTTALVAIDEAHLFAPYGASDVDDAALRQASIAAMASLMSIGRKRGLVGVIATQRLARLAKSVLSDVQNFLIGMNTLDLDIKRAGETIGWAARKASDRLPLLAPGSFVAVGHAFSQSPIVARIGAVRSPHRGSRPAITPPQVMAPESARALLGVDELVRESEPAAEEGPPAQEREAAHRAAPRSARKPWTAPQDEIIRTGYAAGDALNVIIAALEAAGHPPRSASVVSMRAMVLGIRSKRAVASWSAEEDAVVIAGYESGKRLADISAELAAAGFDRIAHVIGTRAVSLGVTDPDRQRAFTEREKEIVREGLAAGKTRGEILTDLRAEGFERSINSVSKIAQRYGYHDKRASWTEADLATLRERYAEGVRAREIAAELGHPVQAVRSKASNLGIRQRKPWSDDERRILVEASRAGLSLQEAAKRIDRPYQTVATAASRMGLSFRHPFARAAS